MNEIRALRAIDRIDELKSKGQWSLRQVKRYRGVGGLAKSHRDYLMDEMVGLSFSFS
jgi:chromatin modification-related protein VID21